MFKKTIIILFFTITSFQKSESYYPSKIDSSKKADLQESAENNDEQSIRQVTQVCINNSTEESTASKNKECTDRSLQRSIVDVMLLAGSALSLLYAHFYVV